MIRLVFAPLTLLTTVLCAPANSVDDTNAALLRGEELARSRCEACHSPVMLAQATAFPGLGGQKQAYLYKQLLDFKAGKRTDAGMQAQVANLSREQLQDLALYYSTQPPLELRVLSQ